MKFTSPPGTFILSFGILEISDPYASLDFLAVDCHPFVEQAIGSINEVMVEAAMIPMAALEAMDSIVDFDAVVEIVWIASVAVALKSIVALAVPFHPVDCAASNSYLILSYKRQTKTLSSIEHS